MKIYFAGTPGGGTTGYCIREVELSRLWSARLWSYYWLIKDGGAMKKGDRKVNLFLDSGAFSALTRGGKVDIDKYIDFIKENRSSIDMYANLDVIDSWEKTWDNQKYMESKGLDPLPTFHVNLEENMDKAEEENMYEHLNRYVDAGYAYIGLGGMVKTVVGYTDMSKVSVQRKYVVEKLDSIFANILCNKDGMPKVKVHGFGISSWFLMWRYPWYSVDSTTWIKVSRNGLIYVPYLRSGKWSYEQEGLKVAMSLRSPFALVKRKHINTRVKAEQDILLQYLEYKGYKLGMSEFHHELPSYKLKAKERWHGEVETKGENEGKRAVETIIEVGVCNTYQLRDELNIIYFLDVERHMPEWPWPFKRTSMSGFYEK